MKSSTILILGLTWCYWHG